MLLGEVCLGVFFGSYVCIENIVFSFFVCLFRGKVDGVWGGVVVVVGLELS